MAADKNTKLSDKEAALIAAAKNELAAARIPGTGNAAVSSAPLKQTPPAIIYPAVQADRTPALTPLIPGTPATQVTATLNVARPAGNQPVATATLPGSPAPQITPGATALAERMAQLMADEAAEHRRRNKRLRMYMISIPLGGLVLAFLWLLFTTLPRLR